MRYLIKTMLSTADIAPYIKPANIEDAGPPMLLAQGRFLDVDIVSTVPGWSIAETQSRLLNIDGVEAVTPVPDTEPG